MNAFERLLSKVINITVDYGNGVLRDWWPVDLTEDLKMEPKYDRRLFLKIKLKNLLDETRMIQGYEEKLKQKLMALDPSSTSAIHYRTLLQQMIEHRRSDIRDEVRATLLAYGYIRGRAYAQIEQTRNPEPLPWKMRRLERVARMVNKYSVPHGVCCSQSTMDCVICEWMNVDSKTYLAWKNARDASRLRRQTA